jgi:alanyl-tRNA synthetase
VIAAEEESFLANIDVGLDRVEKLFTQMKLDRRGVVSGGEAADMYQTYGFPPELFENLAAERNLAFDWAGFREEMKRHGEESGGEQKVEVFKSGPLEALKKAVHGTKFVGYDTITIDDARVVGIIANDRPCDLMDEVGHEQPIVIVLDKTPFYGEMGGQVGDSGELADGAMRFDVIDSQVDGALTLHRGHLRAGKIFLDETVSARVNAERRQGIRRAHSATHLLHYALRKHLGEHALQQGSKVDDDWLRFDFAHGGAASAEQLRQIEDEVNAKVLAGEPVQSQTLPLADARRAGAMMLFGEKYPDQVRMVSMGEFSRELCGGTHLANTAQVGLFRIVAEESVAAGTRRITALTGRAAAQGVRHAHELLAQIAAALRAPPEDAPARVEALLKEVRQLRKAGGGGKAAGVSVERLLDEAEKLGPVTVVIAETPGLGVQDMRQLIDQLRRKASPLAALLGQRDEEGGKVTLIAGLSRDLVERKLDAVAWVKAAAAVVEGSGGGRPDLAQAGGKLPDKLPQALAAARAAIGKLLS